jgi:hypothetical protein
MGIPCAGLDLVPVDVVVPGHQKQAVPGQGLGRVTRESRPEIVQPLTGKLVLLGLA